MIGLSIMALVDEGRLRLEDRVKKLLPDVQFNGPVDDLSLWHLMTHTSGIGEGPTMRSFHDPIKELSRDQPENRPIAERYPDGIDIEQAPGTTGTTKTMDSHCWGKSSAALKIAQFTRLLDGRIFDPLGMANSSAIDRPYDELTTGYHRAPGHDEMDIFELMGTDPPDEQTIDGINIRGNYLYIATPGSGEVQSSLLDMSLYAAALMKKRAGSLRPETFSRMVALQHGHDERLLTLGLTFFRRRRFGRPYF